MGWTSMNTGFDSKNSRRIKEFLMNEWSRESNFKALDYSKKGNTVYMAVKRLDTEEIFAVVTLISFDDGEFFWKVMDESMGPCAYECPQRILKLLTTTDSQYAKEWRESCWKFHKDKKDNSSKFQHGDVLRFPDMISFSNGHEGNEFILVKEGRRTSFAPYKGQTDLQKIYSIYRITRWRDSNPKVLGNLNQSISGGY